MRALQMPPELRANGPATLINDGKFLSWFASQGIPMIESKLRLGGLEYSHFASLVSLVDGRTVGAFGSSIDRRLAALKCAGEVIERQVMAEFFLKRRDQFPKAIRNSNGWAVHGSKVVAAERALNEALERHLLLKSFFTFGWSGFSFQHDIQCGEMKLRLLTSRFVAGGKIAGIVAAQSPHYPGVSFGYALGQIADVGLGSFWQSAIFEASDKFLRLEGREAAPAKDASWISQEIANFINQPFDMDLLTEPTKEHVPTEVGETETHHVDLSVERGLDFPLHAAFVRGESLIPLFWKSELDSVGAEYIWKILSRNGIADIPDRHPIL